jgi:hypothetical protein
MMDNDTDLVSPDLVGVPEDDHAEKPEANAGHEALPHEMDET